MPRYRMPVDEVNLRFHAADAEGLPLRDLKVDEVRVSDNGQPPRRILAFDSLQDSPIHAGLLIDTSESMERELPEVREVASEYAQRLFRQETDRAFVMDFGYGSSVLRDWTNTSASLVAGVLDARIGKENPLPGTAIYDALFRACFYQFGKTDRAASGNFIVVFSDGQDNASHTGLSEAINACQSSNTAIYAFQSEEGPGAFSTGRRTLAELASESGGRVFRLEDSPDEIYKDLRIIEADLRSQYRLVYKPAELRHDGAFHWIELEADRASSFVVRSGYYAPTQ